jgi:hypothetical protein
VTDNPNNQGRKRLWIRFEREYAAMTVHRDWFHNDRGSGVWLLKTTPRGVSSA